MGFFSGEFGGSVFCGDLGVLGDETGDGFGNCFGDFLGDSGPDFLGEGGGVGFAIGSGVGVVGVEPPGSDFPSNHKQIWY